VRPTVGGMQEPGGLQGGYSIFIHLTNRLCVGSWVGSCFGSRHWAPDLGVLTSCYLTENWPTAVDFVCNFCYSSLQKLAMSKCHCLYSGG
jgi:hypothetical protein